MASFVTINEAQEHLAELLERMDNGEEILIQREGKASAKLAPVGAAEVPVGRRVFGQNLLGVTYIAPDFDAPMTEEELQEWGH